MGKENIEVVRKINKRTKNKAEKKRNTCDGFTEVFPTTSYRGVKVCLRKERNVPFVPKFRPPVTYLYQYFKALFFMSLLMIYPPLRLKKKSTLKPTDVRNIG
jgi:hypothetical protein